MPENYVVVAGNIGVGKSTLTKLLANRLGWVYFLEPVATNPFLELFYQDMPRWGFHSQVFFLTQRMLQHLQLLKNTGGVIQDRSIYEDAEIFAQNLYERGQMSEIDYKGYLSLYEGIKKVLEAPNLILHLRASVPTLQKRIKRRGREYEKSISFDYLEKLNYRYEEWSQSFALCPVIDVVTDNIDYSKDSSEMEGLVKRILSELKRA